MSSGRRLARPCSIDRMDDWVEGVIVLSKSCLIRRGRAGAVAQHGQSAAGDL
ncbi:Uncharacterised protein [Mycobacteroides abscessus subsp. abscessus]|nr:Uncharacterised protein [Mycobacteroides abscessus subsp. abscessus]